MRLRASMDAHSTVTRIGADEFAFHPLVFSEDAATDKARMLIEILSAPYDGERTRACRPRSAARSIISATRPPIS